jgi:hypothetical protein
MTETPYSTAPDRAFWSRSVARNFSPDALTDGTAILRRGDRVMSAGSCFAANIVPYLEQSGFSYVRTEQPHPLLQIPPEALGYASFSAAYGNIYTSRQLTQLIERVGERWAPAEPYWEGEDGTLIDPFRPGLRYRARSVAEFEALTRQHLACVQSAIEQATVFVFTLGLTETWVAAADGAAYPACPGTVAGTFDPARHVFRNLTTTDIVRDLTRAIRLARRINPALRVVLTVSPVPLVATATGNHVLPATIYSKSVLRAAAGEVAEALPDVVYFPAYEIVTGPQAPEEFFEADRRNVSKAAVETVMQALFASSEANDPPAQPAVPAEPDISAVQELSRAIGEAACEEEMADLRRPR